MCAWLNFFHLLSLRIALRCSDWHVADIHRAQKWASEPVKEWWEESKRGGHAQDLRGDFFGSQDSSGHLKAVGALSVRQFTSSRP